MLLVRKLKEALELLANFGIGVRLNVNRICDDGAGHGSEGYKNYNFWTE